MQKLSCNVQFAAATIKQFTMFPKQVMPRTGCACTAYSLVIGPEVHQHADTWHNFTLSSWLRAHE